ncbi:MAG: response regulator transcription factor [Candidatus Melainabacteria bacterium]|nr:response regulator transcription factor [Candidatus Melainabacteria bacterium]
MENIQKSKVKLMLVEDHALTRLGLKVAIEKYDHDSFEVIAETPNGREAVDLAKEKKPDVVIMDIGLLELDGIEATKRIKASCPDTKVIMLTSHESEREVLASLASGADGYCLKGTEPEQLFAAIESVHSGNAWLSSQVAEKVLRNFYGKDLKEIKGADFKRGIDQTKESNQKSSEYKIPIIPLSERELEVLKLIVDGKSNQDIAGKLFVTLATVKTHVRSILNKLSVDDRTQAAVKALREGIVSL